MIGERERAETLLVDPNHAIIVRGLRGFEMDGNFSGVITCCFRVCSYMLFSGMFTYPKN